MGSNQGAIDAKNALDTNLAKRERNIEENKSTNFDAIQIVKITNGNVYIARQPPIARNLLRVVRHGVLKDGLGRENTDHRDGLD